MRLLYERYGLVKKPLTLAAVQSAVEEIAGHSFASFFENYVSKRNDLPLSDTFQKLGIEMRGQPYAADMYLIKVKDTPLRRAMFGF
jgi:predicted metalloprotease with PDZ domain